MDEERFDNITRIVTRAASRRGLVHSGIVGLTGLFALRVSALGGSAARRALKKHHTRKRKHKKRPPLQLNQFGCVDVGQPCLGQGANCCSGVCDGAPPGRGKPDLSRCVGHNQGVCASGINFCAQSNPGEGLCAPFAGCLPTTGRSFFCATESGFDAAVNCRLCNRDSDCTAAGFPPGSACVIFTPTSTNCPNLCPDTQNRACVAPGV